MVPRDDGCEARSRTARTCGPGLAANGWTHDVRPLTDRLDEPLRVAVAGRVKAGKSTVINALVGERLAPTDAGECTKIVTWYRYGIGYDVTATLETATDDQCRSSDDVTGS